MAVYNFRCVQKDEEEEEKNTITYFSGIAEDVKKAINQANKIYKLPKPHGGKPTAYRSAEDSDAEGRYKLWTFPVFPTNKDELFIFVKVYLKGGDHAGSCQMWCDRVENVHKPYNPIYSFISIPAAAQFEVMLNFAVKFARERRAKEAYK